MRFRYPERKPRGQRWPETEELILQCRALLYKLRGQQVTAGEVAILLNGTAHVSHVESVLHILLAKRRIARVGNSWTWKPRSK